MGLCSALWQALCVISRIKRLHFHAGSSAVAELAALARPRYHFAGTKNVFYARPPYINTDLGAGAHVTRFIGLASVSNMAKQKSLHALGLVPAASMEIATLQQKPEVNLLYCKALIQDICSSAIQIERGCGCEGDLCICCASGYTVLSGFASGLHIYLADSLAVISGCGCWYTSILPSQSLWVWCSLWVCGSANVLGPLWMMGQ